jgi:formate--tetrahydrofolate ligase
VNSSTVLRPIRDIAAKLGIDEEYLIPYGRHAAKVDLALLDEFEYAARGKMILVTAMTPTSTGEGKTVTSIGLGQALDRMGKRAVVTLREPSLGPVFGVKGGAAGAGLSQVEPSQQINLHFTGDLHAITAAHNLLAAMVDAHLFHGNELEIAPETIFWPRAMDMNDRALRQIVLGLGGRLNGIPRETGFVITAASEIMAILALASSRDDLRARLSRLVVGFTRGGSPVRAADLKAVGAMLVLLSEAVMPNLVQTTEGTPAFVHAGPFANIAHGTSSVISQRLALALGDYVVNETGFASDLGAEKYFDIVSPSAGIKPAAAVLVATVKALRSHGAHAANVPVDTTEALMAGFANLGKHIDNVKKYGVPVVVSVNRFSSDAESDLATVVDFCRSTGVPCAVTEFFARGGAGGEELADLVAGEAERSDPSKVRPLYAADSPFEMKIETIAREIYGAKGIVVEAGAKKKLKEFASLGYGQFPVCIAKTQSSLSDDPKLLGAPSDWTLRVSDARLAAGAGFVVIVAGNMMLMPGLPKRPQAVEMDVVGDVAEIVGMR